jgi:hypothetical protein
LNCNPTASCFIMHSIAPKSHYSTPTTQGYTSPARNKQKAATVKFAIPTLSHGSTQETLPTHDSFFFWPLFLFISSFQIQTALVSSSRELGTVTPPQHCIHHLSHPRRRLVWHPFFLFSLPPQPMTFFSCHHSFYY